jgi:glycosyltransferase involved in cell wall biosynthesis
MSRHRILHVSDFHFGGGSERVFRDTMHITQKIDEIAWYVAEKKDSSRLRSVQYIFLRKCKRPIVALLEEFSPDIVHIHNIHNRIGPSVFLALRKAKKKGIKPAVFMTLHDFFFLWPNPSYCYFRHNGVPYRIQQKPTIWDFLFKRAAGKSILHSWVRKMIWVDTMARINLTKEITAFITPSEFLGTLVRRRFPAIRVVDVRNPCNLPILSISPTMPVAKTNSPLRIIFLGRLSPEKGLVDMIQLLNKNKTPVDIHIFGEGPQRAEIEKVILQNSLTDKVALKGLLMDSDKGEQMKQYDALILPSTWYENAPLTIVEAAFAGLRILTSDFGGMKELAERCGGEYLFDLEKPHTFDLAISQCFDDVRTSKPVRNRNLPALLKEFSMETYSISLQNLYAGTF